MHKTITAATMIKQKRLRQLLHYCLYALRLAGMIISSCKLTKLLLIIIAKLILFASDHKKPVVLKKQGTLSYEIIITKILVALFKWQNSLYSTFVLTETLKRTNKYYLQIEHKLFRKSNWWETDQLTIYKEWRS